MSELTLLHFSDTHNWDKLDVIASFVEQNKVDATLWTGDAFDFDTRNKEGLGAKLHEAYFKHAGSHEFNIAKRDYLNTYAGLVEKQKKGEQITQEEMNELQTKQKNVQIMLDTTTKDKEDEIEKDLTAALEEESQKAKEHFAKIAQHCPIYGVLGNHDLNVLYDALEDEVNFLEETDKEIIKSKNGLEFVLKGDNNTFEVPVAMNGAFDLPQIKLSALSQFINPLQINYNSGQTLSSIDQEIRDYAEKGDMQNAIALAQQKQVLTQYQEAERKRLGSIDEEIDIYLAHKTPHCKVAAPHIQGPLGDVSWEYANKANMVCGGHVHNGQAGKSALSKVVDYLKSEDAEKVNDDGEEISVYKMDRNEMQEFNTGGDYFLVYSYDDKKQLEHVDVYEFTYDMAA